MTSFKGPLLLVVAMALFALLDANSKLLAGRYGEDQVLVIRYGALLILLGMLRLVWHGAGGPIATARPGLHLLRALWMAGSAYGFFLAFRDIPLAFITFRTHVRIAYARCNRPGGGQRQITSVIYAIEIYCTTAICCGSMRSQSFAPTG
jgi:hypothetical protein